MARQAAGIEALRHRLRAAYSDSAKSYAQIAKEIGSDHGSVGKCVRGEFATINPTVRQICQVLGIDPDNPEQPQQQRAVDAERIKARAIALWDQTTHEDAERIVMLLVHLRALRSDGAKGEPGSSPNPGSLPSA